MNFGLTADQASVLGEVERLLQGLATAHTQPIVSTYSDDLDLALGEGGFLDIAREDGFGPLDAALVAERVARSALIVEAATSAIVAPALAIPSGLRPIALLAEDGTRPARFLPKAKLLLLDLGQRALAIKLDPSQAIPVDSLFAYPYGRLSTLDGLETFEIEDISTLRRRWRIAVAVEAAGCMAGALALVVDHVKTRQAFGRPLGAFQAVQHRLAMAAETAESCKWLALRAAWSDRDTDAALAATFAQSRIARFTFDMHQFTGAMGLTLEYPLHLWTYRLRSLAGELGGASRQARHAAAVAWPGETS